MIATYYESHELTNDVEIRKTISVCVVVYLTCCSWYGQRNDSAWDVFSKIRTTVLTAKSRRSFSCNVVPFANAGSMKYTLSLFLLCAFNPLRGINVVSCLSFTALYGEVDQSLLSTYKIRHLTRVASSSLKLKKRCKSSKLTLMEPVSCRKWSLL